MNVPNIKKWLFNMATASASIYVHKVYTGKFENEDVTLVFDTENRVWLFGRQVCPILEQKNQYNAVKRYCPGNRILKPKDARGFVIPFKVPNRGALIFPQDNLSHLVRHSKRPYMAAWNLWLDIYTGGTSPAPVEPEAQENERWFKEVATYEFEGVGTYEFEGIVFTGLMDERIMPGNKKKIPGFIAHEITDAFEYEDQAQSTRYLPPNTLGWYLKQTSSGLRKVRVVDERGFYQLITRAKRTPLTERFQDWVYFEVLPTIRETGEYRPKPQVEDAESKALGLLDDNVWLRGKLLDMVEPDRVLKKKLEQTSALYEEAAEKRDDLEVTVVARDKQIEYKDRQIQNTNKQLIQNCTLPSPYSKRLC